MSARERARLALAIDHDLRQPQHSIEMGLRTLALVAADLKLACQQPTEALEEALRTLTLELASLRAASRQVADGQRDLIEVILLESSERVPQLRTVWANDIIERVRRSNRALAGDIDLRGARSKLTFFSDERWVERILGNLISNAIRHSKATRVLLGARRRTGGIVFEVRDNGRGMSLASAERVFGSSDVASLSALAQNASNASGLGLYIVRLLVERLGGSVTCSSSPGRGSLFQVRLPGPLGSSEPVRRVGLGAAGAAARNKIVAILDDDLNALRSSERLFGAMGVEVYADHDPLRWLSVVTDLKRVPDLFIMDFHLRGQDCSLQVDIVQRKWGAGRTKVIVLAGVSISEGVRAIAGRVPVLQKPLCDAKLNFIVEVLAGFRELPAAGYLRVDE
jgi:CheY-like chemotaxis protein/two-component sensor histidine kinase